MRLCCAIQFDQRLSPKGYLRSTRRLLALAGGIPRYFLSRDIRQGYAADTTMRSDHSIRSRSKRSGITHSLPYPLHGAPRDQVFGAWRNCACDKRDLCVVCKWALKCLALAIVLASSAGLERSCEFRFRSEKAWLASVVLVGASLFVDGEHTPFRHFRLSRNVWKERKRGRYLGS